MPFTRRTVDTYRRWPKLVRVATPAATGFLAEPVTASMEAPTTTSLVQQASWSCKEYTGCSGTFGGKYASWNCNEYTGCSGRFDGDYASWSCNEYTGCSGKVPFELAAAHSSWWA